MMMAKPKQIEYITCKIAMSKPISYIWFSVPSLWYDGLWYRSGKRFVLNDLYKLPSTYPIRMEFHSWRVNRKPVSQWWQTLDEKQIWHWGPWFSINFIYFKKKKNPITFHVSSLIHGTAQDVLQPPSVSHYVGKICPYNLMKFKFSMEILTTIQPIYTNPWLFQKQILTKAT